MPPGREASRPESGESSDPHLERGRGRLRTSPLVRPPQGMSPLAVVPLLVTRGTLTQGVAEIAAVQS